MSVACVRLFSYAYECTYVCIRVYSLGDHILRGDVLRKQMFSLYRRVTNSEMGKEGDANASPSFLDVVSIENCFTEACGFRRWLWYANGV